MQPRAQHYSNSKTVVIGLDSVDIALVKMWARQGQLPGFKALMDSSPLVELESDGDVMQGSVYSTLVSGASPGAHGSYLTTQLRKGTYELEKLGLGAHRKLDPFYKILSDHAIRCAVVDVLSDRPIENTNLRQVIDWGSEFKHGFCIRPAWWRKEVLERFGNHPFTYQTGTDSSDDYQRKLRDMLKTGIDTKTRLTRFMIEQGDLDFIFVYFGEGHKAGHFFWKYWDRNYIDFKPTDSYLEEALPATYQELDRNLTKIVEGLDPSDNLVIFAEHGMQQCYRGEHLTEAILERLGLLVRLGRNNGTAGSQSSPRQAKKPQNLGLMIRTMRTAARSMLGPAVKEKLRPLFRKLTGMHQGPNWSKTKAFVLPTDRNSYIRVNLSGREPQGIVQPGEEYQQLLQMIEQEFRALVDPATGEHVVADVCQLRKMFPGPHSENLPDISIRWRSNAPTWKVESERVGVIEQEFHEVRSGNHRKEGFLLAKGPAFKSGPGTYAGNVLQIAPTLLHLYNVPFPDHYEMGPIESILV